MKHPLYLAALAVFLLGSPAHAAFCCYVKGTDRQGKAVTAQSCNSEWSKAKQTRAAVLECQKKGGKSCRKTSCDG